MRRPGCGDRDVTSVACPLAQRSWNTARLGSVVGADLEPKSSDHPEAAVSNPSNVPTSEQEDAPRDDLSVASSAAANHPATPAERLFSAARDLIEGLAREPIKDVEVAAALEISKAQAKCWLERLVDEHVLEKRKKPASYVVREKRLI